MAKAEDAKAAEQRLRIAKDRALRKKLGPALKLSDDGLQRAAEVSEIDLASAEVYWDALAPPEARGLLSAKPERESA